MDQTSELLIEGSFAIYRVEGTGLVVAYRTAGTTEDKQLLIPEKIISLAAQFGGGDPLELLSGIAGLA